MNRHLLAEWRRLVGPDDTIICLGDVAHPDAWRDPRLMLDLRGCPGHRVLVLGNHDTARGPRASTRPNRPVGEPVSAVQIEQIGLHPTRSGP